MNHRPGSSDVDWCETNYDITHWVAEFYNTLSNALFFIIPPLLVYLFRQYARQVSSEVNVVWALLVVVGAGSVYFHATLSLLGQLIDEISIVWVILAALALWYPKRYMPWFFYENRSSFKKTMLIFGVISSGMACMVPAINHVVLIGVGIPLAYLLGLELRRCPNSKAKSLGIRTVFLLCLAMFCWVTDRLFCDIWSAINFPYMHCFWHILIFLSAYTCCVLFAYFDAIVEVPEQMPVLRYWPDDKWTVFGIPYVSLKCSEHKLRTC